MMSSSSSSDDPASTFEILQTCIINRRIFSFKKLISQTGMKDLKKLLLETIRLERRYFFDLVIEKVAKYNPDGTFYEDCFGASINCRNTYYSHSLLQLNENLPEKMRSSSLLNITYDYQNIVASSETMVRTEPTTPLLMAIKANHTKLVNALLFYGAHTKNLPGGLTAFMWSIMCHSSADIQRTLINYSASDPNDPFIGGENMNYLYRAILYDSPIIMDIVEKIPDTYGADVILITVHLHIESKIFKILWDIVNYDLWKNTQPESVLSFVLQSTLGPTKYIEYIHIILKNEKKLRLDLEYDRTFHLSPRYLISNFYTKLRNLRVNEDELNGLVLHLLSHGALMFTRDIDIIYNITNAYTPFLNSLTTMELEYIDCNYSSLMYFKYTPEPNLIRYLNRISPDHLANSLKMLKRLYAFRPNLQIDVLCNLSGNNFTDCREVFKKVTPFPSLLQLARDASKKAICDRYEIESTYKLCKILKQLPIPKSVEDILLLNKYIY